MSFGQVIGAARRKAGLSQKDLAAKITKEDGIPISPQYLNDLERDRRNPPSDYMLKQFARELGLSAEYVLFIAGQYPEDLRDRAVPPEKSGSVEAAFEAFRRSLKESDGEVGKGHNG